MSVRIGKGRLSNSGRSSSRPSVLFNAGSARVPSASRDYGGGLFGPASWLSSANLWEKMASRRWAASFLDNCSNSLIAEVLSRMKACLSTGELPTCLHEIVILSCGRSLGDRPRELSPGRLMPYVKEGCLRSQRGCTPGRSTAPHSSRRLASSGAYPPAFSLLLMWQLRSAQKPTSIRSREHARLSKSTPGDGEGMFGTPFAYIRSGATPCPASLRSSTQG